MSTAGHRSERTAASDERRFLLHGVTWRQFEHWLAMRGDDNSARIAYAEGELELMSPSPQHEDDTSDIERLLTTFSDETGVELACARSRTLKREETQRGAEADTSYFVGRRRTGFPDIVIEVLWTQPLLDKLDIYWNLGIREVWLRRRSQGFSLFVRGRNGYARHRRSRLLADLDLTLLAKYVGTSSPTRAAKAYRAALRKSLARRRN